MNPDDIVGVGFSTNQRRPALAAVFLWVIVLAAGTTHAWEMEAGQAVLPSTSAGSNSQFVAFQSPFSEIPLVFVMPTMEGTEPTSVRVRNVSHFGFDLVQVEAPAADGPHEAMTVDWVAVTPGDHQLPDGTVVEAGMLSISDVQHGTGVTGTESWYPMVFSSDFASTPAMLFSIQTAVNETATVPEQVSEPWLVVGAASISTTGANIALERCEAAPGSVISTESVAYLAIDAGAFGSFDDDSTATIEYETAVTTDTIKGVSNGCYRASFTTAFSSAPLVIGHINRHDGGDGGWLRRCSVDATGVEFTIDEDTHRDTERSHTTEAAGFIAFSSPFFATFTGGPVVPTVSFEFATFSETEEEMMRDLNVVLSETATVDVVIDFATGDYTATAGDDYTATSGQLTIIQGQTSGQIPVNILEDLIYEGDEEFTITLSNPQGATAGAYMMATGTILDDEVTPQVSFAANDYIVDESIGAVSFDIDLSHASAFATSVDWTATDITTTQGSDYSEAGGTINIPALATSALLPITILEDTDVEGDETAQLDLVNPLGLSPGSPTTTTLTITDNDAPASGWAMAAGTVLLPATTDGSPFQTITFDQAFDEAPLVFAMPGSEGVDPASVRIRNITVNGFEVAQVESPNADGDHEALTMNWVAVTPGEHTLPDGTVLEAGSVSTSAVQHGGGVTGTESWESISFTTAFAATPVLLAQIQTLANETAAVPGEASQPWLVVAMRNIAASGVDVALERAEVNAGTVSVPETIAYLAIDAGAADSFDAIDASAVEYETFATADALVGWGNNNCVATSLVNVYSVPPLPIGHQNRHDGGDGGWLRMCSLTITDVGFWIDEDQYANSERNHTTEAAGVVVFSRPFHAVFGGSPPTPQVGFVSSTDTIAEAAGTISLDVSLTAVASTDVTIDYQTADGWATAGSDYVAIADTLTILQGQTTGSIVVQISDDGLVEGDEDFTVTLSNPQGADPGANMSTVVTITDDDAPDETTTVVYSVGDTTNQLGGAVYVNIFGGTATFSGDTWFFPPNDGDRITYNASSKVVFVRSCSDALTCEVTTVDGGIPADVSTIEIDELRAEFESLSAALVEAGDGAHLNTFDLVAAGVYLEIACHDAGGPDTAAVAVSGWTTDQDHQLVVRSGLTSRHSGAWSGSAYRLEVVDSFCITSSVGNLRLEGLQLYCSGAPAADIAGIQLNGAALDGSVKVAETLIRLDDATGTGDRIGVEVTNIGLLDLQVQNTVIWDLGTGADRHAGFLVEDASAVVSLANNTVIGGAYGVHQTDGQVTAVNTISSGQTITAFAGVFEPDSKNNLSSDGSAPGTDSIAGYLPSFVNETTGSIADFHLNCGLPGNAVVTHTSLEFGTVDDIFNGNPNIGLKTVDTGVEVFVQLEFPNPVTVDRSAVVLKEGNNGHQWMVAMADTVADMASQSGSYREVVPWSDAPGYPPSWFESSFAAPETGRVIRLEVLKLESDRRVQITEWEIDFASTPCGNAVDLSDDLNHAFSADVDSYPRIAPWDIGADEATMPAIFYSQHPNNYFAEVWESEGQAVVEVWLLETSTSDVVLAYRAEEWGAATSGADFSPVEGTVTVPAGHAVARVTVPIVDDGQADDWEEFRVRFAPVGAPIGSGTPFIVRIRDGQPPIRASFTSQTVYVDEGAGQVELTVQLSEIAGGNVFAYWNPNDASARMGLDYSGMQGGFDISQGLTTGTLTIPIFDDDVAEPNEVFRVTAPGANGAQVVAPAVVEVVIIDNDMAGVSFSSSLFAVGEEELTGTLTVERIGEISGPETVNWSTVSGGTATPGDDFETGSGVLNFDVGITSQAIDITINQDSETEPDETILVELTDPPLGVTLVDPWQAALVIDDDDVIPVAYVDPATILVDESAGVATVFVRLSNMTSSTVYVDVATAPDTAFDGIDYQGVSIQASFAPGEVEEQVSISILDDFWAEVDESFTVGLSHPLGLTIGTPATATVTITDDDVAGATVSPLTLQTTEEGGSAIFTIALNSQPTDDVTIGLLSDDPTEGSVTPASVLFDSLTWSTPQEITVTGIDDPDIDGSIQYFVETQPALSSDTTYSGLDAPDVSVINIDDELRPIISKPVDGRYYGDGQTIELDAVASFIPAGYQTWFAVLLDDGSDPMDLVHLATSLTGTFVTSIADPAYRIRLVIATPAAMPADEVLRGNGVPCTYSPSNLECASAERVTTRAAAQPVPFELAYAFPDEVMLRFGYETPPVERSSDGGETWQLVSSYSEWWEEYFFIDMNVVEEGATYYYRIGSNYLGQTTVAPGQPVDVPVWNAARIIPLLDGVTWHCPQYARRYFCDGTLHMRLQPETDQSLSGSTIRVFLNEETHQRSDGNGDNLFIDFPTGGGFLDDFVGYDVPGCVVRKAVPDLEIEVPAGEEEVAVDLDGILFGGNSLRFEVEAQNGDISERAILISVLDEPVQNDIGVEYPHFVPVLFGTRINTNDFNISGKGPAGRNSPDCVDGDSWYYFNHYNFDYNDALYFNKIFFTTQGESLLWADEFGDWSAQYTAIADGTYNLQTRPAITGGWDEGSHGRVISRPGGGYYYGELGFWVSSTESSGTRAITIDSTITDLEPELSHVIDEKLVDSPETEALATVRFRLTDADQDIDLSTVTVFNCSLESCAPGQPGAAPYEGFYAKFQGDATNGHYGWFLVDIPLSLANDGVNELRFCASDAAGNPLGTVAEPCVSWEVTRTSPEVFAVISSPTGDTYPTRPDDIISVDGTASTFPADGVALWTFGEQLVSGFSWYALQTQAQVTDAADLVTSFMTPAGFANSRKARLIVAASPSDLPSDYWPDDGELPCLRSLGDGRCDSAEFRINSSCSVDPILATVVRDLPTGSLNVGPEEEFQLQAHVSSHAYTFAYRWSVYRSDDPMMLWPVMTLGYGDAGEGYSLSNNDLTITAAGQGLESGDYLVKLDARYPDSGCTSPWYRGSPGAFTFRVRHSFDGVSPGQAVEGAPFRVYSRTWNEGETGWVFIDEDINNPPGELMYSGVVQTGGYVDVAPLAADLPSIGAPWFVSLGTEEDGSGRSTWVNALTVVVAGNPQTPNVVDNEEDSSCGGAGTECAHAILPGQTWQGEWGEAGDTDYFSFSAGAGAEISVSLERFDLTLPPQHPDTPRPEIFLVAPDDVVFAASAPAALDATGTSFVATLTVDGIHQIAVRTPEGAGQYLVEMNVTSEGGSGAPAFGFTNELTHLTSETRPDATLAAPILDPFGNPITGARVLWEQGTACGLGEFCGNGNTSSQLSTTNGYAVLGVSPVAGGDPLWKPSATLTPMLKNQPIERTGVSERLAVARSKRPMLGIVRTSGRAVVDADLPSLDRAAELTTKALRRALARSEAGLKDGLLCPNHELSCPSDPEPVYRAVQLPLNTGDDIVDVEVRILDGGLLAESLDGHTILNPIPLTLEIEATVRDDLGGERQVVVDQPASIALSDGTGGAIDNGENLCSKLDVAPGGFTYMNAREAALQYSHLEPDGTPCCYIPTEYLNATVVVDAEVDDGQGGTTRVIRRAGTTVESIPRPKDPCHVRAVHDPIPQFQPSYTWKQADIGSVYLTDSCGNIAYGVGLNDSPSHTTTGDEFLITSPVTPNPNPEGLWAYVPVVGGGQYLVGQFHLYLEHNFTTFPPSGIDQTIDFSVESSDTDCTIGGRVLGSYTVHLEELYPSINLWWDPKHDGVGYLAPDLGIVPLGAAVRDGRTGQVAVWRAVAHDGRNLMWNFPGGYQDIPMKFYVAKEVLVFDHDGNLHDSYLEPVEGAELCTGVVELPTDGAGTVDVEGPARTTCTTIWGTVASGLARSDPDLTGHAPNSWVEMGLGVGITKAPTEAGNYLLVMEPLEGDPLSEPFRRGDSWAVNTVSGYSEAFQRFEVGGESCKLDDLSCSSCKECVGGDIGLRNGNVRHAESNPVPGVPPIMLERTYDSLNSKVGLYGAGWFSAYDALASTETWTSASGEAIEQVRVTTEDNRNLVFLSVDGGDFNQTLPQSTVPSQLDRSGSDLVLQLEGDSYRRTFRGADGKLETISDTTTGRAFTITFDGGTGMPTGISDSWKGTIATFTASGEKITGITPSGGPTTTFDYGGDDTLDTVTAGATPLRSYAYSVNDELETVSDGAGYIVDSYVYSGGVALSSTSAGSSILSVDWSPGRAADETMAEVVSATGSTTYYYLRQIAGRQHVVEVAGDCSCSGNDRVYAYDSLGHLVLEQDAMGYITHHTYLGDGRKLSDEVGLRRPGCDPAAYPDPYACRLTPDGLLGLSGTALTQTEGYGATWYAYGDPNWPDRPTQTCRYSTLQDGGDPRTTCRNLSYDTDTGLWLTSTVTGWTGQSAAAAAEEIRTTTRTLYDGVLTAAFDPGGSFNPSWMALAQPSGKVQSINGPRSDVVDETLLVYYPTDMSVPADLRGRLAAQRDPEGGITRYEDYDNWGHARRVIGPTGITTESTYDGLGRVLTSKIVANAGCNPVDDPLCSTDLVTTYTYEADGGPLSTVSSPDGNVSHFEYDAYGRTLNKSRGPTAGDLRERMHSVYDPITGLLTESTVERDDAGWTEHSRTDYQHTSSGQVEIVTRPRYDGDVTPSVEEYVYDAAGRIESLEDPNHDDPNTSYEYDPVGRLTTVKQLVDPLATGDDQFAITTYGYDIQGNLTSVTDANGNLTQYLVDDFGQTTLILSPVTGATQLTYNAAGQALTRTDSRGVTTTTVYDAAGRPTDVVSTNDVDPAVTLVFDYDAAGRRELAQSPDVTETFTYDRRGAVLTVSSNRGGTIYDTEYTYTLDGAVDTITYPSGRVVDYAHDFTGRPTGISVKAPGGGSFEPVASNIDYLPYGPAEHLEYGPVGTLLTEDRDFDWHYRRTHQTVVDYLSATRLDLDLGYDPAGNLTAITDTVGQRTANYGYDDLGRLTSADWSSGAQTRAYDYDSIGNLERIGVNESLSGDGEVLFDYDLNPSSANSPVLSSIDTYQGVTLTSSHTVVTDSAGNISDDGQADYDYTLRNHLESRTLDAETSSYTFSADGRRVGMTRGATTLDVVLGLGGRRLSRVLNGTTRDYVWLGDTLVGYYDGTANEPVRVITNHIGFPLMAVDAAGTTVWEPLHEPYGELIGTFSKSTDPGLRYPGQWQDEVDIEGNCVGDDCTMPGPLGGSVSLFENGFRWYRSAWGRYSQSDPIGQSTLAQAGGRSLAIKQSVGGIPLGQSLFSYANAAPTRYQDPIGLFAVDWDSCSDCRFRSNLGKYGHNLSTEAIQNDIIEGMLLAYRMVGCVYRTDLMNKLVASNWGDADGVKIRCLYGPNDEVGGKKVFDSCHRGASAGSVGKTIVLCETSFADQHNGAENEVGDSIFHEWLHVSAGVPGARDTVDQAGAISRNTYRRLINGGCGTP